MILHAASAAAVRTERMALKRAAATARTTGSGNSLELLLSSSFAMTVRISKMDAARRQLQTALRLWFTGGDAVSIHALAYAAYEIGHSLSKRRDPTRRDLIFDSDLIKEKHRRDWNDAIKAHANFFKHANRHGDKFSSTPNDPNSSSYSLFLRSNSAANAKARKKRCS
jgi:hypothetical protein